MQLGPDRLRFGQPLGSINLTSLRLAHRGLSFLDPSLRQLAPLPYLVTISERAAQQLDLVLQLVPVLANQSLRFLESFVTQHLRQETGALAGFHRREELKLLLIGEVRVEELLAAHAETAGELRGDFAHTSGDRLVATVAVELGVPQRAHHPVMLAPQAELELDAHRRAPGRPVESERLLHSARGRGAVDRPGYRLEDCGLARAVGTDDSGKPGPEIQYGIDVLAEVREGEPGQPHRIISS